MGDTLLGAAEEGEVDAQHGERSDLCFACADSSCERERLFADRQRLCVTPGHHQSTRERPQRIGALRRGRLGGEELDRALERGEYGVVPAGLDQVFGEPHVHERRAVRIVLADELDRPTVELQRSQRGTGPPGQLACPGAGLGQVELRELSRVRHRGPELECPLEVRARLGQPEDRL
jgi:hypothetical protein